MKICVWRTNHPIADTIARAALVGLNTPTNPTYFAETNTNYLHDKVYSHDIHIGYGILRGMADVFRECDRQGKPWFCIDRGYWKPGHYDGYYRVSLRGTQQTSGWPAPDWDRWEKLGLSVEPMRESTGKGVLSCPPTDYVEEFFDIKDWFYKRHPFYHARNYNIRKRCKGSTIPLEDDFNSNDSVETFNSSVGWEALRRGIPVESDPVHSIVGAWQESLKHRRKTGTYQSDINTSDVETLMNTREQLFATMAGLQLTLDEMRGGKLMPLLEKLLAPPQ